MQKVLKEVREYERTCTKFIASSENLLLDLDQLQEIKRLKHLLKSAFSEIHVFVFLRRQDLFVVSQHNDAIKRGTTFASPFGYIKRTKFMPFLDYFNRLQMWKYVFYDNQFALMSHGNNLQSFVGALDISHLSSFKSSSRENTALSPPAAELVRRINFFLKRSKSYYADQIRDSVIIQEKGRGLLPARSKAIKFYQDYKKSNQDLYSIFGGDEKFFDDDFIMYPEKSDIETMAEKDVTEILQRHAEKVEVPSSYTAMLLETLSSSARVQSCGSA